MPICSYIVFPQPGIKEREQKQCCRGIREGYFYCALPWRDALCRLARRRFVDEPPWHLAAIDRRTGRDAIRARAARQPGSLPRQRHADDSAARAAVRQQ